MEAGANHMHNIGSSSESISMGAAEVLRAACRKSSVVEACSSVDRARLEDDFGSAAVQSLSVAKISRAWLMSWSMSSAAALGEGRSFAGVNTALGTAGRVAGVGTATVSV